MQLLVSFLWCSTAVLAAVAIGVQPCLTANCHTEQRALKRPVWSANAVWKFELSSCSMIFSTTLTSNQAFIPHWRLMSQVWPVSCCNEAQPVLCHLKHKIRFLSLLGSPRSRLKRAACVKDWNNVNEWFISQLDGWLNSPLLWVGQDNTWE